MSASAAPNDLDALLDGAYAWPRPLCGCADCAASEINCRDPVILLQMLWRLSTSQDQPGRAPARAWLPPLRIINPRKIEACNRSILQGWTGCAWTAPCNTCRQRCRRSPDRGRGFRAGLGRGIRLWRLGSRLLNQWSG